MNKPSNSPMPADQPQTPSQQQPPTVGAAAVPTVGPPTSTSTNEATPTAAATSTPTVNYIQTAPICMKPAAIFAAGSQVQQTPLALTTTSSISASQIQAGATTKQLSNPTGGSANTGSTIGGPVGGPVQVVPVTTTAHLSHQIIQSKVQPVQLQQQHQHSQQPHPQPQHQQQQQQQNNSSATNSTHSMMPITLTSAPTSSGPTALVIIPQHSASAAAAAAAAAAAKGNTKMTPVTTTTISLNPTQLTLATSTASQPSTQQPIQLPTPIAAHVSNLNSITNPITAQQQPPTSASIQQHTMATHSPAVATNRTTPNNLPVIPITTMPVSVKSEPNKYICCLLDNGIRCDRVAGNASFSARIQKIVGNKKLSFALDPTVRHAYICEHHKAIITVAKKSATLTRDTKANNKNFTTQNNNSNNIGQHNPAAPTASPYNEQLSRQQQQILHHPMNIDMIGNQQQQQQVNRMTNNHAGKLDVLGGMHQGQHIPYAHQYQQNPQSNQVGSMNVMLPGSGIDNTGGDSIASSSGGVEVDLQQLQVNTLRRYKRHFRVQTRPGLNKMQLAESLKSHFKTLPIIEKEAITYFVYIVKCYRNKLDHNPKAD